MTLHADLVCANSDGLQVGARGITINLNQFAIRALPATMTGSTTGPASTGSRSRTGPSPASGPGVYYDSSNHAKVMNVRSINNSGEGIEVENSRYGVISGSQAGAKNNGNGDDGIYLDSNTWSA